MEYKKDWGKSKDRLSAFWNREILDRCCVSVVSPSNGSNFTAEEMPSTSEDQLKFWTDGEWIVKRETERFENTYFGGEAFPQIFLNLGAVCHAGYFKNANYQFNDTVWHFPFIKDLERDILEFDSQSFMYKKTIELAQYFVSESKGRYFVSHPDTSGNADALAQIRGTSALMIDMAVIPNKIHSSLDILQKVWLEINEKVYQIVKENNEGGSTIGWLDTWSEGRHVQLQSDISVMISPAMFEEFIIPELISQTDWADRTMYHLDGIEQIRHLDLLLSIEKLSAIQWNCVTGQPSPLEFIPELKKIQQAGKGLEIYIQKHELVTLMEQLSSKGLYLCLEASSEDEAKQIIKTVEKLTHE